ncbi:HAD-IIB family hydrolase [Granulicella tundricola]|uniref:HAD-superfamily hydrolase, subfamily IIB n=1 Tax=Granulicella tundricola (strain ATCC BAA-1859 / DSM 23138 / MP5ACTX9) TaxID=1198114 RepID=E8WZN0_GRATM|nr:HAD family hydrolase [Granulicella tundricola]ADW70004.1 HAD-superfamily hydrolase, subfamily IIB [Granulicella tundricola MP5ACTX9]
MPHAAPIRLIAIDIDGTLLSHEGRVGAPNQAALALARSLGVEVVIATGRRHCYAMRVLRDIGLPESAVLISSNGTVVRNLSSQLIERTHMSPEATALLCNHLAGFRNALVITFDKVGPDGEDARGALVVEELAEIHASIERWVTANELYIVHVNPIENALKNDAPIQAMLVGTMDRMAQAEALLVSHPGVAAVGETLSGGLISLNRTAYPERDLSILDILPAGCSKGAALLRLAASRGIQPSEIMAIGDNWNDLSMLEVVGHPVLMGNAPEDLKTLARQHGWRIGLPHTESGVAEAIESALTSALTPKSHETTQPTLVG